MSTRGIEFRAALMLRIADYKGMRELRAMIYLATSDPERYRFQRKLRRGSWNTGKLAWCYSIENRNGLTLFSAPEAIINAFGDRPDDLQPR